MSTTIQINDDTIKYLKLLRDQYEVQSYDALLKILMEKSMKPKKSMWGSAGKMSMSEILRDLRDESDRF